ncbi:multicopper oxidase domain-containing protein [Flexibacterium corallicola]|uniref:multicopper oxidase domain-containing protein n=1 Tax=Flexibacterium corallicola TaxID=3037259 RepID=UPI00286EC93A|nr:multicopper oxidase domain-containing protein [Pseudovibrio sp. M1P-2-3]
MGDCTMTFSRSALSRRSFLKLSTALGLACPSLTLSSPTLAQAQSASSFSPTTLTVTEVDGRPVYNEKSPGPTLTLEPGGTLDIELVNNLSPLHDDCTDTPNAFHGLNTTNLHTHGLHVSPNKDKTGRFDADNVFINVVPKDQLVPCEQICGIPVEETFRRHRANYRFEIAQDHPSGTFWYHAHKHGSTQRQVGGGLAGPLIVPDKPGTMPSYIAQAPEHILMLMNRGMVLVNPQGGGKMLPHFTCGPERCNGGGL